MLGFELWFWVRPLTHPAIVPRADPLGLGTEPASLSRFVEGEVINGRWAMLGVAGMIGVEALGYGNWYDAPLWAVTGGKATYFGAELPFQFDLGTLAAIVSGEESACFERCQGEERVHMCVLGQGGSSSRVPGVGRMAWQ